MINSVLEEEHLKSVATARPTSSTTVSVRLALVGCGTVAREFHLPVLAGHEKIELVALIDRDLARARELAKQYKVAAVYDDISAISRATIDAVIIATPPAFHASASLELLAKRIHVFVEKPVALNLSDARAMVQGAHSAGVALSVGVFRRLLPCSRLLRSALEKEIVGRPLRFDVADGAIYGWAAATLGNMRRELSGGGVLMDMGSHTLDRLLYLFPGPAELLDYRDNALGGIESDCFLRLRLEHKGRPVQGTVELSRTRNLHNKLRIECERGVLELRPGDRYNVWVVPQENQLVDTAQRRTRSYALQARWENEPESSWYEPFREEIDDWLDAIRSGREPELSGKSVLPTVELIEQCYRAPMAMNEPWVQEGLGNDLNTSPVHDSAHHPNTPPLPPPVQGETRAIAASAGGEGRGEGGDSPACGSPLTPDPSPPAHRELDGQAVPQGGGRGEHGRPHDGLQTQTGSSSHTLENGWSSADTAISDHFANSISPVASNSLPKRILLTGATGFIGCRVAEILRLREGCEVRALVHNPGNASRLARLPVDMRLADFGSQQDLRKAVEGCDAVVHCAIGTSWGQRREIFAVTVDGTRRLAQAALAAGVKRFVHLSSIAVHGNDVQGTLDESTPIRPPRGDDYSESKAKAEKVISQAVRSGLPAVVLRPTNVFGAFSSTFITRPIQALAEGRLVLVDSADCPSNTVYVDNLVEAIICCLKGPDRVVGETFTIGQGDDLTWGEFYGFFARELNAAIKAREGSNGLAGPANARNWRLLGWPRSWYRGMAGLATSEEFKAFGKKLLETDPLGWLPRKCLDGSPRLRRGVQRLLRMDQPAVYRRPEAAKAELVEIRPRRVHVNIEKARKLLDYAPVVSRERAMQLTLEWVRHARLAAGK
ncbi:MAG: NAD-dependent epimerase/dehydratase family protein [Gemmataceae bacterium]